MYDGATNSSVSQVEIIYCRSLENGYPKYYYVGQEDLEHAHADGIFSSIDKAMNTYSSVHWKEKVMGGGSDGVSVNNIVSRGLSGRSYVVNVHCVAHRLELGILSAIKTTVQDMLNFFKPFHYSPKALRDMKTNADSLEEKSVRLSKLQDTRWVTHISKAVKYLLENYTVIWNMCPNQRQHMKL